MRILEVDTGSLSATEREVFTRLYRGSVREIWDSRGLPSLEGAEARFMRTWGIAASTCWLALGSRDEPLGYQAVIPRSRSSTAAWVIYVAPGARRNGLARRFLRLGRRLFESSGIEELHSESASAVGAGRTFAEHLGAGPRGRTQVYEAVLDSLPGAVMESASRVDREPGISVEVHNGRYPENDLTDLAHLIGCISEAYGNPSEVGDRVVEELRRSDDRLAARGARRLIVLAREATSNAVIGYAETVWWSNDPEALYAWNVALREEWRGRALGGTLHARLLLEVRKCLPQVRFVRIRLQDSARSLHARCERFGYRMHHAETLWSLSWEALCSYLDGARLPRSSTTGRTSGTPRPSLRSQP